MKSLNRYQKLYNWYSETPTIDFQQEIERDALQWDELHFLMETAAAEGHVERLNTIINVHKDNDLNHLNSFLEAVKNQQIDCVKALLPYAHKNNALQLGWNLLAENLHLDIAAILFQNAPKKDKQAYLVDLMSQCLHHTELDGVDFCLKQSDTVSWMPRFIEKALSLCCLQSQQYKSVIHYCSTFFQKHPDFLMETYTYANILRGMDLDVFKEWVTTMPTKHSHSLLLEASLYFEPSYSDKMIVLFQHISINEVLQELEDDDETDAIEWLTEQYALYQKNVLNAAVNSAVSKKPLQSSKRKI